MKQSRRLFFILALVSWMSVSAYAFDISLPPPQQSQAYQQFVKQPKSELSKLIYLLNRLKGATGEVIYDGHHYEAGEAVRITKDYLLKNYHKETADYWIKRYCYKSEAGQVILVKAPDGESRPVSDVVLEELTVLEKISTDRK